MWGSGSAERGPPERQPRCLTLSGFTPPHSSSDSSALRGGWRLPALEARARSSHGPRGSLLFVAVGGTFPVSPSFSDSVSSLEADKTPRIWLPG